MGQGKGYDMLLLFEDQGVQSMAFVGVKVFWWMKVFGIRYKLCVIPFTWVFPLALFSLLFALLFFSFAWNFSFLYFEFLLFLNIEFLCIEDCALVFMVFGVKRIKGFLWSSNLKWNWVWGSCRWLFKGFGCLKMA